MSKEPTTLMKQKITEVRKNIMSINHGIEQFTFHEVTESCKPRMQARGPYM